LKLKTISEIEIKTEILEKEAASQMAPHGWPHRRVHMESARPRVAGSWRHSQWWDGFARCCGCGLAHEEEEMTVSLLVGSPYTNTHRIWLAMSGGRSKGFGDGICSL
jgi:hypothetical protein